MEIIPFETYIRAGCDACLLGAKHVSLQVSRQHSDEDLRLFKPISLILHLGGIFGADYQPRTGVQWLPEEI